MKKIKGVLNLFILIILILLNIWLYSTETTYSIKRVSKQLENIKKKMKINKIDIFIYNQNIDFEKTHITIKTETTLEKFPLIFSKIMEKQFKVFPFLNNNIKISDVFESSNKIIINITGFNPEDYSILEIYLLKRLIQENIFLLFKKNQVSFIFNNGFKDINDPVILNESG